MRYAVLALAFVASLACSGQKARQWNETGIGHSEAGRYPDAARAFAEAVRLDPDVSAYQYNLGRAFAQMRQYDAAETHLREALRLDPGNVDASRLLSHSVARIQARGLP